MKKYIFVKQDDLKDCGVASLLMIIRYYKGNCSKEILRRMTNTSKYGTSVYDIIMTAEKFGFNSFAICGGFQNLKNYKLPVIAHVKIDDKYNHFVVLYNIDFKNQNIVVADPANKVFKMSFEKFKKISTNNFIIFNATCKIKKINSYNVLYSLIKDFINNNKLIVIKIIIFSIISALGSCFISYFFKVIYNSLNFNYLYLLAISIIIIEFVELYKNYVILNFNSLFDSSLYNYIYNKIISLPYIYFRNRSVGEVVSRITDLSVVEEVIETFFTSIIIDIFVIVFSLVILLVINAYLFVIMFIAMILLFFCYFTYRNKINNGLLEVKSNNEMIYNSICTSINGIEVIRSLNVNKLFNNKFKKIYENYIAKKMEYYSSVFSNNLFFSLIIKYTNMFITSVLIIFVLQGNLDISYLIIVNSIIGLLLSAYYEVLSYIINFLNSKISIERISELCQYDIACGNMCFDDSIKLINFKNMNYRYTYFAKNISINYKIGCNDKILIKGRSGIGKSTLAKIIAGFIKPEKDMVYLNDVDIVKIDDKVLFEKINYIGNSEFLFPDTIVNNITMGRNVDTEKLEKVLDILNIRSILKETNLDLNSIIEENGFNLSAGQKQRIVLARSLLKTSDVYIFDEALANLDDQSERQIVLELLKFLSKKIVIYITHRDFTDDLFNKKLLLE